LTVPFDHVSATPAPRPPTDGHTPAPAGGSKSLKHAATSAARDRVPRRKRIANGDWEQVISQSLIIAVLLGAPAGPGWRTGLETALNARPC